MKKTIIIVVGIVLGLTALISTLSTKGPDTEPDRHIYTSWDTMEYDKCVAVWLISRFYDTDAKFVFCPKETAVLKGTLFDVPGANWSRQHRKCTSDCVLEDIQIQDKHVEAIVRMAHNVELNFWQLDSFPDAQSSFQEVKQILESADTPEQAMDATGEYFDRVYQELKHTKG